MFSFIHLPNSDTTNNFRTIENPEIRYRPNRFAGGYCFIKLGPTVKSCLSKIATLIDGLVQKTLALLSSVMTKIYESPGRSFNFCFRKEQGDSNPSYPMNAKVSKLALNSLDIDSRDPCVQAKRAKDLSNHSAPLTFVTEKTIQSPTPKTNTPIQISFPEEDSTDSFHECFEPPVETVASPKEITKSPRINSDDPDESDLDENYYDCREDPPVNLSSDNSICTLNKKSAVSTPGSIISPLFSSSDADSLKGSTIGSTSEKLTEKDGMNDLISSEALESRLTDVSTNESFPEFSKQLVNLLNLILKNPIDSLNSATKIETVDENITQYTFNLPTIKEFNKRVPSSILSKIPALDYNNLSLIYKSIAICGSKLVSIHSPKTLSFVLSLDKKQETAILMFLNPYETLSVNLNFGPFGNYGTVHIHQIRYYKNKSKDSDSTVYFKESSENWPKTLSKPSDQEDDLWSELNNIKYDLSTQTISEIWSTLRP